MTFRGITRNVLQVCMISVWVQHSSLTPRSNGEGCVRMLGNSVTGSGSADKTIVYRVGSDSESEHRAQRPHVRPHTGRLCPLPHHTDTTANAAAGRNGGLGEVGKFMLGTGVASRIAQAHRSANIEPRTNAA